MDNKHGGSRPNSGPVKSEPTTKMVSVRFPIAALKKINKDRGTESLIKFLLKKAGYITQKDKPNETDTQTTSGTQVDK